VLNLQRLTDLALPRRRVAGHEVLCGGLINTNLKIHFDGDFAPVVLRIYRDGAAACRKEVALYNLIHTDIPVAEIIYAHAKDDVEGSDDLPSFAVLEYVEGMTFQQLKRTNDFAAIADAAASVGATLARMGRLHFAVPGDLFAEPTSEEIRVGERFIDGPDPIPRILDQFLASPLFQQRAGADLTAHLHNFIWAYASPLPELSDARTLVHNDYGNRNILVREKGGRWQVAAILDWELAISGSPLLDVGHFLRYERPGHPLREPHFSRAYVEHGGQLPDGWQQIVKLIDLTALIECLTHDNLPPDVEIELFELINTTLRMPLGV
jgi:aminoglycoside phosphotransferase (APT) family kinase protein